MTSPASTDPRAPNFFILGAAKCGTTSVYQFLRAHPSVFLPDAKETHFFSSDKYETEGFERYLNDYFQGSERFGARGEATPAYFHLGELVAPRMLATLGARLRFIVLLRDPVRRAWSHYLHSRRIGREDRSFGEVVATRGAETLADRMQWRAYYSDGLYAQQLATWMNHYSAADFLVFLTDELSADADGVAARCFEFLGIEPTVRVRTAHRSNRAGDARSRTLARLVNRRTGATSMLRGLLPARTRRRLRSTINSWNRRPVSGGMRLGRREEQTLRRSYANDVERLQRLIGRDLSDWLPADC